MKRVLLVIAMALAFTWTMAAQDQAGTSSTQTTTTTTTKKSHKKAASSDTSASDTASSKSTGKSHTVTGCISKDKDANGNYTLTNGRYKKGVDVTGSDDLSAHAGHKVQLTGTWTTPGKTFDETKIKHISETCTIGSAAKSGDETTTTTKKSKKSKTGADTSSTTPKE